MFSRHSTSLATTYGLNACKEGYTWRRLDEYDYVCVEESQLADYKLQDARSPSRSDEHGNCLHGFTKRAATPTVISGLSIAISQSFPLQDRACVPVEAAKAARADYLALSQRLELYQFFNGVDSVFLTDNNRPVSGNNRFVMA